MTADHDPKLPAPVPSAETLGTLRSLASYMTSRAPMTEEAKFVLDSTVSNQQDKIRLVLSVIGAHKVKGMADLLKAIDFCKARITSQEYLNQIATDPEEMRKHLELLAKLHEFDIEYLRMMTSDGSEKKGFSGDPKQQYNFFFEQGAKVGAATLPQDMSSDSRRKVMSVLDKFMALAGDKLPAEPATESRVIDIPPGDVKVVDRK
jgi:hypothetical protein